MKKILIAYCSRTGCTRDIAQRIAKRLDAEEWGVELQPIADDLSDVSGYDAVVVGAPIHAMRWAKEASAFIDRHHEALAEKPVALYFDGYMTRHARRFFRKQIDASLDDARQATRAFATGKFGGRLDRPMAWPARLLFGVPSNAPLDTRDEDRIQRYANDIHAYLQEQWAS